MSEKLFTKMCPVSILQNEWEFGQLYKIFENKKPKNILEIGSFYGGTLWFWLLGGYQTLNKVISVDYPVPPSDDRFAEMIQSREKWKGWFNYYNSLRIEEGEIKFKEIIGNSMSKTSIDSAKEFLEEDQLDFLFIDGGHDYYTVKSDYENYSSLVKEGGLIVLHDVSGLEEVKQFWAEIKKENKYLELCDKNGWGIGIIYK